MLVKIKFFRYMVPCWLAITYWRFGVVYLVHL